MQYADYTLFLVLCNEMAVYMDQPRKLSRAHKCQYHGHQNGSSQCKTRSPAPADSHQLQAVSQKFIVSEINFLHNKFHAL